MQLVAYQIYMSKKKIESLIDSKVMFLTLNTLTVLQWQDTFTVTMINWTQK